MSKVFLSWSGEPSRTVALALKGWLPEVVEGLETWMSHEDIRAGERWSIEVFGALATTDFGILCVTTVNRNSPWLNFEAGALATGLQSGRVFPYLIGLPTSGVQGPLAQFQGATGDREGTRRLLLAIARLMVPPVDPQRVEAAFAERWPALEARLGELPEPSEELASEGYEWPLVRTPQSLRQFLWRQSTGQQEILAHILGGPRSVRDLAKALELAFGEVFYRCKDLEHNGIVTVRFLTNPAVELTPLAERLLQDDTGPIALFLPVVDAPPPRRGIWRRLVSRLRGA